MVNHNITLRIDIIGKRTLIRFALLPELSRGFDSRFTPIVLQISVRHDLATDEFVLKVGTIKK